MFIAQEPLHSSKPPPSPPQHHITSTPPPSNQLKNNKSDGALKVDIKSPSPVSDGRTAQNILELEDTDATSNIGEQNNLYASVHKVTQTWEVGFFCNNLSAGKGFEMALRVCHMSIY